MFGLRVLAPSELRASRYAFASPRPSGCGDRGEAHQTGHTRRFWKPLKRKALLDDCSNHLPARRILPFGQNTGAIAQLGERVLCKHEVVGSIPSGSTIHFVHGVARRHYDLFVLDPSDLRANGWAPASLFALPRFALLERGLVLQAACSVFAGTGSSGAKRRQGQVAAARSGRAIAGQGEARCGREIKRTCLLKEYRFAVIVWIAACS